MECIVRQRWQQTGDRSARLRTLKCSIDRVGRHGMYDAIVVGARCAGAPTAMLLARQGYKVLLVDRATFPSTIPQGHFIHRSGPRCLHRWGLLDQVVATGCPPI